MQEKKLLERITELVTSIITTTINTIADCYKTEQEKKHKIQQQFYAQNKLNNIQSISFALQHDLFEIIGNRHYPKLTSIVIPSQIRVKNYRILNGTVIYYQYSLDKEFHVNYAEKIPAPILAQILENMRADLVNKQNELKSIYPMDYIYMNFPFLYSGIQIVGLKDIGTCVILEVTTNIQP